MVGASLQAPPADASCSMRRPGRCVSAARARAGHEQASHAQPGPALDQRNDASGPERLEVFDPAIDDERSAGSPGNTTKLDHFRLPLSGAASSRRCERAAKTVRRAGKYRENIGPGRIGAASDVAVRCRPHVRMRHAASAQRRRWLRPCADDPSSAHPSPACVRAYLRPAILIASARPCAGQIARHERTVWPGPGPGPGPGRWGEPVAAGPANASAGVMVDDKTH